MMLRVFQERWPPEQEILEVLRPAPGLTRSGNKKPLEVPITNVIEALSEDQTYMLLLNSAQLRDYSRTSAGFRKQNLPG
jgi:hypothetical protein